FLGNLQSLGIFDHWHGHRNALIAAAGVDYHRKFAAAHPGVGTGSRFGNGTVAHAVTVELEHGRANVGTVIAPQAFLANFSVVLKLGVQNGTDILQVAGIGKVADIGNGQQTFVRQTAFGGIFSSAARRLLFTAVQQYLIVLLNQHNVG